MANNILRATSSISKKMYSFTDDRFVLANSVDSDQMPHLDLHCLPKYGLSTSFVDLLCFCSVLCLLCLCARLFICALWSPAGKGLTSWLSFVVSNYEFVTFPLLSWVRCGT